MEFTLYIIFSIAHWLPTALAYNFIFGKGKIFHFGPIGVSLAIAYGLFLSVFYTQSFALGIVMAIIIGLLFSLLFAWVALRLDPDGLGVISIAMHLSILSVIINWQSVTRGALGIPGIPRVALLSNTYALYGASVIMCVLFIAFFLWLDRSSLGRQMSALAEHPWQATSLGINKTKNYVAAFSIAVLTSLNGNFFGGQYVHFISPSDYHFQSLIFLLMVVVAGKPGSVKGVTLATILIITLRETMRLLPLSASTLGPTRLIIFGLILLAAVWYRRDSLFPPQRSI